MDINDSTLKEILLKGNYLSEEEFEKAHKMSKKKDVRLVNYLLSESIVTPDLIGQAVSEYADVPYADLNSKGPSLKQMKRIPEKLAFGRRVVLFDEDDSEVLVTTDDPSQEGLKEELEEVLKKDVRIAFSLPEDIDATLVKYKSTLETRFTDILESEGEIAPRLVREIFEDAISLEASDIHFEPKDEEVRVRFRIDGVLQNAGFIPIDIYAKVLNRIKVMSSLRIDEHFIAQDGSTRFTVDDNVYDLRTSIVPTVEGEKVVLRVLSSYVGTFSLDSLGLSDDDKKRVTKASKNPFGMILTTGPTGSGKTTTLYSVLRTINTTDVNIMTIEEPVEYRIDGINQIQVDRDNELSFAKGLRSIVRQDPDVILVGEIRDKETAEIAVNAALTGHLMFSTFHANDAATSIPRLQDMGIEPFLLASTLELIIAQRLVRTICESCRHSITTSVSELEDVLPQAKDYFDEKEITLYKGKGCEVCNHTGYDGRTALFELIDVTPQMADLILTNPSSQEVWKLAKKEGSQSMFEDGMAKIKAGVTTIEEVNRVAPSDYVTKQKKK